MTKNKFSKECGGNSCKLTEGADRKTETPPTSEFDEASEQSQTGQKI
jgi:hypothetical protein